MSTVSICAPSRAHAQSHFVVMSSCAVARSTTVERERERLGEPVAERARERGRVVERDALAVERVPDLVGAVARLAPARRASASSSRVARSSAVVTASLVATSRP